MKWDESMHQRHALLKILLYGSQQILNPFTSMGRNTDNRVSPFSYALKLHRAHVQLSDPQGTLLQQGQHFVTLIPANFSIL